MTPQQTLAWYLAMGVDEVIGDEAIDHFSTPTVAPTTAEPVASATSEDTSKTVAENKISTAVPRPSRAPRPALTLSAKEGAALATKTAHQATSLEQLKAAIEEFNGCGLNRTAMNTVFGDGHVDGDIMIVGDAPNADEDRLGKPFQGDVGALLDKMMAAIGLDRETGFYVSNIVPWRPPGNRKPSADELTICLPFIKRHIELVNPKILFVMGHTAISALLEDDSPTKSIRGKWRTISIGKLEIATMPSYHPSRLLKQPQVKRDSWQDLLEIKRKISE